MSALRVCECVSVCECLLALVCLWVCLCVCACLSVQPMAAIAGSGSCASLCAKYIWSVSYFEFKLKNFLASFAALLCCVCERQMPHTHTRIHRQTHTYKHTRTVHTMYVFACMYCTYVRVCVLFCKVIIKTICTFSCCVTHVIVVVVVVAVLLFACFALSSCKLSYFPRRL